MPMHHSGLTVVMDLKENKIPYFSCRKCEYSKPYPKSPWHSCEHPATKELDLIGTDYDTLIQADIEKIERLITQTLNMSFNWIGMQVPTFEFPFIYETMYVIGCEGFKEAVSDKKPTALFDKKDFKEKT